MTRSGPENPGPPRDHPQALWLYTEGELLRVLDHHSLHLQSQDGDSQVTGRFEDEDLDSTEPHTLPGPVSISEHQRKADGGRLTGNR